VYIIGIALGYCITFTIVKGICTLRCHLVSLYGLGSSEEASPEALDQWQHVDIEQPKESITSEA